MSDFGLSPYDLAQALKGLAPYGFRHIESPSEVALPKGKGYFGMLPNQSGSVSTEISSSNDQGAYPLLVPGLTQEEMNVLLNNQQPTDAIYQKAEQHSNMRKAMGQSPFASAFELRYPTKE